MTHVRKSVFSMTRSCEIRLLEKSLGISLMSCWTLLVFCPGNSVSRTANESYLQNEKTGIYPILKNSQSVGVPDLALKNDVKLQSAFAIPSLLFKGTGNKEKGFNVPNSNDKIERIGQITAGPFEHFVKNEGITKAQITHRLRGKVSHEINEIVLPSFSKHWPSLKTTDSTQSLLSKSIFSAKHVSTSSSTLLLTRAPSLSTIQTLLSSRLLFEIWDSHSAKPTAGTAETNFDLRISPSVSSPLIATESISKDKHVKPPNATSLSQPYSKKFKNLKEQWNLGSNSKLQNTDIQIKSTLNDKKLSHIKHSQRRVRRRSLISSNFSKHSGASLSPNQISLTGSGAWNKNHRFQQHGASLLGTSVVGPKPPLLQSENQSSSAGQLLRHHKSKNNNPSNQLQLSGMSNHISSFLSPMSETDADFYKIGKDIISETSQHWQQQDKGARQSGRAEQTDKLMELDKFTKEMIGGSGPWCRSRHDAHAAHHLLSVVCKNVTFEGLPTGVKLKIPDVDKLRLEDSDFPGLMEALAEKPRPSKVIHLFIENSFVENISEVLRVFDVSYIISLNLEKNLLSSLDSNEFDGAKSLEYLDLSYNNIEQLTSDTLYDLPRLKSLDLRFNKLGWLPSKVFMKNTRLHDLELSSNRITSFQNDTFVGLGELWTLDVSHNPLRSEFSRHGQLFAQCANLRKLVLSHCYISDIREDTLTGLGQLEFLDLFDNELVSIPDRAFKDLAKLTSLNLHNNRLLSISPKLPLPLSLKHLSVYNNSISKLHHGTFDGLDLHYIFLDRNKLESLPAKIQLYMITRNVSLSSNPWRCDCDLVSLIHFVQRTHSSILKETACATVATVAAGRISSHLGTQSNRRNYMAAIQISDLQCPPATDCHGHGCKLCPRGLQRRVGEQCVCMEGTQPSYRIGAACEVCPQHHFKSTSGNARCQRCSPGSMATRGPASMCACAAGHQNNAKGDCQKCSPGSYKLYEGVGPCLPCPASGTQLTNAQAQCETQTLQITYQTQPEPENQASTSSSVVVTAVCLVLLGTLLLAVFCLYRSKRNTGFRFLRKMKQDQHSPPMVGRVTYSSCDNSGLNGGLSVDVCSRQTDFRRTLCVRDVGAMIGRGAFGQVFEASAYLSAQDKETTKVAIKKLKDMASAEEIKNFRLELEQMLNVGPHPNIIGLYGSIMHDGQLCIVMEYAELGDLLTYLRTDVSSPTQYVRVASNGHVIEQTTPEVQENALLMIFAWQICKGMRHLESHRYIHRDLAARNCLLTRGPVAKVSDFGLSKDAYELGHYKRVQKDRVPFKWLSPEALLWGQYSSKSDVWAFGILLWELYTFGGTPYPQVTTEQLRELHENGYRLSRPPACPEQLYRIMRSCWRDDARQRPSFKQLEHILDSLIQRTRGREYLELNPHSQHSFLSFTTEDMDDKMTSVDFVRHHRRQATYENQNGVEHVHLNYTSLGHVSVATGQTFSTSADGSETQSQLNSKSTVTSGFQSMSSAHTM